LDYLDPRAFTVPLGFSILSHKKSPLARGQFADGVGLEVFPWHRAH